MSSDGGVMRIACASTPVYAPHAAAMLHSVLSHAGDHRVEVFYLKGPRYPPETAELMAGMVEGAGASITFLDVPDVEIAGLTTTGQFPDAMWYRIFLPELIPEVDRVLYLDIDTIAVDSLGELWETDLGDSYLAAVTNVFEPHYAHRPAELGLAPDTYFNSGVVLLNLRQMREDGMTQALRDCALEHAEQFMWVDQDALNVVLGHRRLHLHPRWNCMNSVLNFPWSPGVFGEDAVAEARSHPGIRHFEGPEANKPWHYLCDHRMRDLYFEHRRQTPWPTFRLEGVTARNFMTRLRRSLGARVGA